jgi:hypothetical protein
MINKIEENEVKIIKRIVSVQCDICGKIFENTGNDIFELQEFHFINFTGGYGSVFGDGSSIKCDICQHCLYNMIKKKYREIEYI